MAALAIRLPDFGHRLTPRALKRAVVAGSAWGLAMGVGLTVLGFLDCGVICVSDAVANTLISVAAGVCTIGPLVLWHKES